MRKQVIEFLDKYLPNARYSDGTEAKCIFYRLCNVVDIADN